MEFKLEHVLLFFAICFLLKMIMNKCGCKGLIEGFGGGACKVTNESQSKGGERGAVCPGSQAAGAGADAELCCGLPKNNCNYCLSDPPGHFGMSPPTPPPPASPHTVSPPDVVDPSLELLFERDRFDCREFGGTSFTCPDDSPYLWHRPTTMFSPLRENYDQNLADAQNICCTHVRQ